MVIIRQLFQAGKDNLIYLYLLDVDAPSLKPEIT